MAVKSDPSQEGERVGIWGASGSGKSTYTKRRIAGLGRLVVFDPRDEYGGGKIKRFTADQSPELERHILTHWRDFKVAYIPPAGAEAAALSSLCWYLVGLQDAARAQGKPFPKMTLVAEELNQAFPTHGASKCPGFAEVCNRGRARHIEVIGISQRVAGVSGTFRDNLTEHVIFRQGDRTGAERAAGNAGLDWRELMTLEKLTYFHVKESGTERKKIAIR